VRPQEASPRLRVTPRRRRQSSLDQDVADRARRNGDTELAQLAHDPLITPARVLAGEAHDQLAHLRTDRRPARRAVRIGPAPGDKPAVPAQQRLRPHRERTPGTARQHSAERRQQHSIARLEPRPIDLAAKDRQLVAEHKDLELLRSVSSPEEHDQLEHTADDEVTELRQAKATSSRRGRRPQRCLSSRCAHPNGFLHPTRARQPPDRTALGRAIRELRQERGWTMERLAHEAGIHWTYLGGIERGRRNPSWENVVKVAAGLGIRTSELVRRAEDIAGSAP